MIKFLIILFITVYVLSKSGIFFRVGAPLNSANISSASPMALWIWTLNPKGKTRKQYQRWRLCWLWGSEIILQHNHANCFFKIPSHCNDFVIIDNRDGKIFNDHDQVIQLCDRKHGVGADGVMLIEKDPTLDFNLIYYNAMARQACVEMGVGQQWVLHRDWNNWHENKFQCLWWCSWAELQNNGNVRLKMNR